MSKNVVLLSGGLDSCVLATQEVRANGPSEIIGLSILYGQKHYLEIESANAICRHLGIKHEIIELPKEIMSGAKSSLIEDAVPMPKMATYQELVKTEGISPTYVPNRNALMISVAVARALVNEAPNVWIGVHAEDARNFAYPDCTPEFIDAMRMATWVGSGHKVQLWAPFQRMYKGDIVKLGLKWNAPMHLTTSCYSGEREACGTCPTCIERLEAFRVNGVADPIAYAVATT